MKNALGDLYTGVFGNDDEWRDRVVAAGNRAATSPGGFRSTAGYHRYIDSTSRTEERRPCAARPIPAHAEAS